MILTVAASIATILSAIIAVIQIRHEVTNTGPAPVDRIVEYFRDQPTETPSVIITSAVPTPQQSDTTPPTAPQNLRLENTSNTQTGCEATITWEPSEDDTEVQSYRIYASGQFSGLANGNFTAHTVSMFAGEAYSYTISAFDGSNESAQSNALFVTC